MFLSAIYVFAFLFAIFTLVLIHEFGHFLVARLFRVKVERFSIGFGKPFYRWKNKKNDMEYVLAPIPLGGYVKFLDTRETEVPHQYRHLAFDQKSILKRLAIIVAGPMANIVFVLFAFWLMFVIGFKLPKPIVDNVVRDSIASRANMRSGEEIIKVDKYNTNNWEEVAIAMFARIGDVGNLNITTRSFSKLKTKTYQLDLTNWKINSYEPDPFLDFGIVRYVPHVLPIINKVAENSPASKFGLKENDRILAVEDKQIDDWEEFIDVVKERPQQQIKLLIKRNGKKIVLVATTDWKFGAGWKKVGFLGVGSLPVVWPESMLREYRYSVFSAFDAAWHKMKLFVGLNYIVFAKLFTGKLSFQIMGGPVSIFVASGQALMHGFVMFLGFLAMISLSIALINLLPLPGLDGGYVVLFLIEAIRRRPLSMRLQTLILRLGIIFFVLLIFHVTINDLRRIFG